MTHTLDLAPLETVPTVRFEPCAGFRTVAPGVPVCACGWLDSDHSEADARPPVRALASVTPVTRMRRRRRVSLPARRAS
jgi:hypothetical protein